MIKALTTNIKSSRFAQPENLVVKPGSDFVAGDKIGTSVSDRPRHFWKLREGKKVSRATKRVRNASKKLTRIFKISIKSSAHFRSSVVSTKPQGRVTSEIEQGNDTTRPKIFETDFEIEVYTPSFYRTPCTTHEADQVEVVNKSGNKSEHSQSEPKNFERDSKAPRNDDCRQFNPKDSKKLTVHMPHFLMSLCSQSGQTGELSMLTTIIECTELLHANEKFHSHLSRFIFSSTFSAADFDQFILRKFGHVELKPQPKQICGNFPKIICAGPQKRLHHDKNTTTSLTKCIKVDKWARATNIGASFWYAKVRNGERQQKEKEKEEKKEPEQNETPDKDEGDNEDNKSETSSCYESSNSGSDTGSDSDSESFSDYAILAEATANFPKTKDFHTLFDFFSPYARGKHPDQIYGLRGEFDTLFKELVLASNFPTFHEELVRMGHEGYREKAQETFEQLEMGIQSVQKYLVSDFFMESRAAFQFTETTFNKGVEYAKRFYELEDRFFVVDLYDYEAVLKILGEVQYLDSELELWHLDVELAAKKNKHVHLKIGKTMELYHLSTRDCACKAQRILDVYQRYFHTDLVVFYSDASYGEIHDMHGFDGTRFEDMRRLWVAQLLVEKNLEVLKKGVDVLMAFGKDLSETLKGVIESCKTSLGHRKLY